MLVSPPVAAAAPTTIIAIAIPFANDARTTCDLKEANTVAESTRENRKRRERKREREKIEKRTKTKGHKRREEGGGVGFASLRVKPDLHDVDFYPSVHSRWNPEGKGMQMERSFRETGI